mmetsp:Transcript_58166/g.126330  ORF Transcript_58166/g.126330 Transcript_58166/m.126330 type:complete len:212 (+) Transcript_58166:124-759(+)
MTLPYPNSMRFLHHVHLHLAVPIDARCDPVARMQPAHSSRRAGHDEISGLERHDGADVTDERGHAVDHGSRVARLPQLAIDTQPHVQRSPVLAFLQLERFRKRQEAVVAFGHTPRHPLQLCSGLLVPLCYIDGKHVACDRLHSGLVVTLSLDPLANDHRKLKLVLYTVLDSNMAARARKHKRFARPCVRRCGLEENHRLSFRLDIPLWPEL